jgi:diguanylate cyclase (GGDEF)-like protein/PAS domain S-box-containing protein
MSQRILLIQDDAAIATIIGDALKYSSDEPFEMEWVRRCSEALERLADVEAILVDLSLPDSCGLETFSRLFHAAPQIPILMLINPKDEHTAKVAVLCGAQDYIFKDRLDAYLLPKAVRSMIERAANVERIVEEKERAKVMLNSIDDAVLSADVFGGITYLNVIAERLTGWSQEQARGHRLEEVFRIVDGGMRQAAPNPMDLAIRDNQTVALAPNCVLIRRDGVEAAIEHSAAPIHDRRGDVTGSVMVFHDVSAAQAMTLKMSYLAQHDSLTDLPNRVLLNDRLAEAVIALSGRRRRELAVLVLDLDRFKHINDSLGQVAGDHLLQSVARRLLACVRSSDIVSRLGGDEFGILLWDVRHAQEAATAADKILRALREPHIIDGHELHVTGSIGIVTYPDDGTDADTLMKKADFAMYHAKDAGRDNYQFFKSAMNIRAMERQAFEDNLHYAIERQQLLLYYQPKIDLNSGAIIGVEALIRWDHPQRGLVTPGQFIAIAEECGSIVPIGRWVLREACRQARAWQAAGLPPTSVAINVSSVELRDSGFVSGIRDILRETGLEPRYLELELTETAFMDDSRSAMQVLKDLKNIGVVLTLDDFGTGYSSLSYLKRFPIDSIKIDQSFVRDLASQEGSPGVVIAVIGLGKSLDMRVVAEGVETREQLEILREHGCNEGQGYYFSRPVPAVELPKLLQRTVTDIAFA